MLEAESEAPLAKAVRGTWVPARRTHSAALTSGEPQRHDHDARDVLSQRRVHHGHAAEHGLQEAGGRCETTHVGT